MARAFVFPGQGSQAVGMGVELAEAFPVARETFEEVDEALQQHLFRLMKEGPEGDLTLTENAQPALMAVSLAAVRVLESESGKSLADLGDLVAGHSLGEYSALAAARSFSLADAARLLKLRGQSMQAAVPVGEGAMAAILGLDLADAEAVAEEAAQGEVCNAANDNAPGQIVLSGAAAAIERAVVIAKEKGAKRAMPLPVSAPFHCDMMQPAAEAMADALGKVNIQAPSLPLVANVTAEFVTSPDRIRELLVQQVCGRVRWRESVLFMKGQNVDTLVEVGAGKVLTGLVRRIDKEMTGTAVNTPADIEAFLGSI
ncbi:ACP S-malonyltransferase [Hwanghaeella sp.]|uniref:ACP S-malonyltransferase n=1 Tax=Hwanghaeella sp. TaxID=2605943 RepID=UPI003CCC287A